jgi:hypothetical protein
MQTARNIIRTAPIATAANDFMTLHPNINWTVTETAVRFDNSCGTGHTLHIKLLSDRPEHVATVLRQTVWDDGDRTHVTITHGDGPSWLWSR